MPETTLRFFARLADRLEAELLAAEAENLKELKRIAEGLSLGPLSTDQLRRMGHPYAARAPAPPLPPYVINRQKGLFAGSWKIEEPRATPAGLISSLTNTAPYASFLRGGTGKMIARPFDEYLRRQIAAMRREQRIAQALQKALQDASAGLDAED